MRIGYITYLISRYLVRVEKAGEFRHLRSSLYLNESPRWMSVLFGESPFSFMFSPLLFNSCLSLSLFCVFPIHVSHWLYYYYDSCWVSHVNISFLLVNLRFLSSVFMLFYSCLSFFLSFSWVSQVSVRFLWWISNTKTR